MVQSKGSGLAGGQVIQSWQVKGANTPQDKLRATRQETKRQEGEQVNFLHCSSNPNIMFQPSVVSASRLY